MSGRSKKSQPHPNPANKHAVPREIATAEAGQGAKPDLHVAAEEASDANEKTKTEAKRPPVEVMSKKQRKRL